MWKYDAHSIKVEHRTNPISTILHLLVSTHALPSVVPNILPISHSRLQRIHVLLAPVRYHCSSGGGAALTSFASGASRCIACHESGNEGGEEGSDEGAHNR